IGYGANAALLPKPFVRKGRGVAHVDAAAHHHSAFVQRLERWRNQRTDWSKDDGRIQRFRRQSIGAACPGRAEFAGELLPLLVARPCEGKNLPALMTGDLDNDVRSRAEAVNPQSLRLASFGQRAIPNHARTEQRRSLGIGIFWRHGKTKPFICHCVFCVTAIERVPRKLRILTKVLPLRPAKSADAIRPAQPGNPDAITDRKTMSAFTALRHSTHDFMTGNERKFRMG